MKKTTFLLYVILTLIMIGVTACSKVENVTTSGSKLILDLITGNDVTGSPGSTTIFSDVVTTSGGIYNDNGTATMRAVLLDPTQVGGSFYQSIVIDRIYVEFSRADGLDEPGKDIPYSFSQDVSVTIDIGYTQIFSFVLVPHTAKVEPPLVDLRYSNEVLKFEAKVTFFGKDIGGHRVEPVRGSVSVWCGNFADTN